MCTAVLSVEPGRPVLLAGVRDELTDRAWDPPGRHWPQYRGLIGGRDRQAGGTWLAVAPQDRRVACVLNGIGQQAPAASRQSRGVLPLRSAAGLPLDRAALADLDPFHLVTAEPGRAVLQSWDGRAFTERDLPPGLHFVVNSGLASDLLRTDPVAPPGEQPKNGREHELARIAHFLRLFTGAPRPEPRQGEAAADAWGAWLPLVNGDGLDARDQRALLVRRDLDGGRTWGTTSVSLVALTPGAVRYDFTGDPGNPAAWSTVL